MTAPRTLVTVTCIHCRDEFTGETFRLARAIHDLHTCRRTPFLGPPSAARSGNLSIPGTDTPAGGSPSPADAFPGQPPEGVMP